MAKTYDVAVVGAGPGGCYAAWLLTQRGFKVLLLEKRIGRCNKPCGGGLTQRAMDLLPFDLSGIIEDYTYNPRISINNRTVFAPRLKKPVISMVMRENLDNQLALEAENAGVTLIRGAPLKQLSYSNNIMKIRAGAETYYARLIIGADGVNGPSARLLGLPIKKKVMLGLEAEIKCHSRELLESYKRSAHFDFEMTPSGYGWVFPKKNHLSVGVLTTSLTIKNLKHHFNCYLKSKGLSNTSDILRLKPHLIPYRPNKGAVLANKFGLVIGDAAGLTDPITGEGIYYALKQATMAADVITDALQDGTSITQYNRVFRDEFKGEILFAYALSRFLYQLPFLSMPFLKLYGRRLGMVMIKIASGDRNYRDFISPNIYKEKALSILKTVREPNL